MQHSLRRSDERITKIELTPVFVPFREMVVEAMQMSPNGLGMALAAEEPWVGGDFVICRMVTEAGTIGWGECFLWLPESGYTPAQVIEVITVGLAKYVLGRSPYDVADINLRMRRNVMKNDPARGLLDMAMYDLLARIENKSMAALLGGPQLDTVPLCGLVPLGEPGFMAQLAASFAGMGHRSLRLKLGLGIDADVTAVSAVRAAVGETIRLRVDYNQAYDVDTAILAIRAVEPYGVEVAEQPVGAEDFLGMVKVQKAVSAAIMAHEGCFSLADIRLLAELGGIGVVGINNERPGGMTGALEAMALAKAKGMGVVLHNQPLGVCSAMLAHLAAARHADLGHDPELFGHIMLSDDLLVDPLVYENGGIRVPTAPGWGVDFALDKVVNHAVGKTVTQTLS